MVNNASKITLNNECPLESQYATGKPSTSKMEVLTTANFKVSQMGDQSVKIGFRLDVCFFYGYVFKILCAFHLSALYLSPFLTGNRISSKSFWPMRFVGTGKTFRLAASLRLLVSK